LPATKINGPIADFGTQEPEKASAWSKFRSLGHDGKLSADQPIILHAALRGHHVATIAGDSQPGLPPEVRADFGVKR
jgi:hypothetical protein